MQEGHLKLRITRRYMETSYHRSCMKEIERGSPNNGREKAPTGHFSLATSSAGNRLQLIKLLAKGAPENPPRSPGCHQGYWLLPTN